MPARPALSLSSCRRAFWLVGALVAGWPPAWAGGVQAGALTQRRCLLADVCKVPVLYGVTAGPANNCGVKVADVVLLLANVTAVEWRLAPAGAGLRSHRFSASGRVAVDDNNDAPNDLPNDGSAVAPSASPQPEVFLDEPLADSGQVDRKTLGSLTRQRPKAFTYSLSVERQRLDGSWEACDKVDPVIVNRGL